jgi:hypothetical protein
MVGVTATFVGALDWKLVQFLIKQFNVPLKTKSKATSYRLYLRVVQGSIGRGKGTGLAELVRLVHGGKNPDLLDLGFESQRRTQRILVGQIGRFHSRTRDRRRDTLANWWIVAKVEFLLLKVVLVVSWRQPFPHMEICH